jgi:hypothetical protein
MAVIGTQPGHRRPVIWLQEVLMSRKAQCAKISAGAKCHHYRIGKAARNAVYFPAYLDF